MASWFEQLKKFYVIDLVVIILAIIVSWSGFNFLQTVPYLPVRESSAQLIDFLNQNFDPLFSAISLGINLVVDAIDFLLLRANALVIITIATILGVRLSGWKLASFIALALATISAMGYWEESMITLSLVITATFFSLLVGIPLGIAKAHSPKLSLVLDPVLDFMQTMPLFVYLIPAVLFFSIGNVPGVVSTFIFATPPAVRLTSLGIQQIPVGMIEASKSFGATFWQQLLKVELPLSLPSIMTGVNQTIMLSLSMVVVASMIGAEGLGQEVLRGITRLKVGQGIASGIGIVFLAMILDRLTKTFYKQNQTKY